MFYKPILEGRANCTVVNGTAAALTATLSPQQGKQMFLAGISVSTLQNGSSAGMITINNIDNGGGNPTNAFITFQNRAASTGTSNVIYFDPPLQGQSTGTNITVVSSADTNCATCSVAAWGFSN